MVDTYAKNEAISAADAQKLAARAEFRVFGQGIIDVVTEKMWPAHATLFKVRVMPPETYILSKKTDEANVKVRDGLLDIKVKTGQTPEGYEIFQPRGKFQFPVKRDELLEILSFLKVDLTIEAEEISFDEFKRLAADCPDLAFVTVEKKRYGFSVNGVICEYAYLWLNGAQIESACCESEDYGAMRAAVEALGIAEMPNVNYLKAIKRVIGFGQ